MDTENHKTRKHEDVENDEDDDFQITGGDQQAGDDVEESQNEIERLEKLEQEKKKFIEEIQNAKQKDSEEGDASSSHNKLKFLLDQAEVFAHFVLSRNEKAKNKKAPSKNKKRAMHEEKDEDESLMRAEKEAFEGEEEAITRLTVQPTILKGGNLKDYQINGLNWLISLYENGINGILADEMGLGKTIQTISLVAFLREYKRVTGPHLIIGPKSTLGNWFREFQKWLPNVKVLKLVATKAEREDLLTNHLKPGKFDVCLTSYEGINKCKPQLKKFNWKYIIIDEAHKIKNEESVLSKNLRDLKTNFKLLLTGTPLQNNLHELWSLLNFLLPDLFSSSELFDSWFEMTSTAKNTTGENAESMEKTNVEFINQLHKILKPFLLRRTKSEVELSLPPKKEVHLFVGLVETQINLYKTVLSKKTVTDDKKFYLNILMQLRKVCNHPYLFEGVEDEGLPELGAHIIHTSGKMVVLDKLLSKLENGRHQVLIFSQMTRMLDILEDYCHFKKYKYCRIDGDTDMDSRDNQIVDFVSPDSDKFIFLLSTRAGGLGINLATADTVILYDSDWNPQVDLQAMDRAHRIGQKSIVNVYRLISENTVEEKIVERQMVKLKWDTLVIQQGRFQQKNKMFTRDELKNMIQYGASEIFRSAGNITDEDIDILLERGERRTSEKNSKLEKIINKEEKNILDLAINDLNYYTFEDVDYQKKKKEDEMAINEAYYAQIDSDLRTRREKNLINITKEGKDEKKRIVIKLPEFQFFANRERLIELLTKQAEWEQNKKSKSGTTAASHAGATDEQNKEDNEGKMQEEEKEKEKELNENRGLTNQEFKEKTKLLNTGFVNWNKEEHHQFIKACEKYGRKEYSKISEHIGTKTTEEVTAYAKVLWARITELPEYQKHVKNIERGEAQIQSRNQAREMINNKCTSYRNPKEEMEFNPTHYNKSRSKFFSIDHDKFLVYISHLEGYGNWDKIKRKIKDESLFRFDHFFKSRTEADLNKRMQSLLKVLEKEKETTSTSTSTKKEEGRSAKSKTRTVEESDEGEQFNIKKKTTPSTGKEKEKEKGDKKDKEEKKEKEKEKNKDREKEKEKKIKSSGQKDKEKKEKKEKEEPAAGGEGSGEKGKPSVNRDERYKERQAKKDQAELKKLGLIDEEEEEGAEKSIKKKDNKKLKQTSILSFGQGGNKDKKAEKEEEKGEEDKSPKEDSPNEGEEAKSGQESPAKDSKKRKIDNISSPQENKESHQLKMTKLTEDGQ